MKYPVQVLFREYFEGILAAIFLALFLRFFVFSVLYIPVDSMTPGLQRGDFVLGWRLSYGFPLPLMKGERLNFKAPQRGDLIAFRFPGDEEQIIIRRVVATEGDWIEMRAGAVFVNDEALVVEGESGEVRQERSLQGESSYPIRWDPTRSHPRTKVPKGGLFVMSDHRAHTDDSRDWGFVPFNNVESEIVLIWLAVDNREQGFKILWSRMFNWVH